MGVGAALRPTRSDRASAGEGNVVNSRPMSKMRHFVLPPELQENRASMVFKALGNRLTLAGGRHCARSK